jgi:hypothetical protein
MALIFPAYNATRARARQNACIANLSEIATGLRMYRLDEGAYPQALYGFYPVKGAQPVYGLYPHWVRSQRAFVCPNNPALRRVSELQSIQLEVRSGNGSVRSDVLGPVVEAWELRDGKWTMDNNDAPQLYPGGVQFAVGDSYDLSFVPTRGFPDTSRGMWERHYQLQWRPLADLTKPAQNPANQDWWEADLTEKDRLDAYSRQLIFRQPKDSTLVTICTYHREYPGDWQPGRPYNRNSRDVALFLDGHTELKQSNITGRYDNVNGQPVWNGWQMPAR